MACKRERERERERYYLSKIFQKGCIKLTQIESTDLYIATKTKAVELLSS